MQATEINELDVYRGDDRVAVLRRTARGAVLEFESEDLRSRLPSFGLAFHLPAIKKRISIRGVNLHPFFAGLLPEGLRLSSLTRRVKTSADDLFSLLATVGADCIGDIAVTRPGEPLRPSEAAADLSHPETCDFHELLAASLDAAGGAEDMSLPGVQEKISASMISLPLTSKDSGASYLLKLNPPDRPLLVENEHFFLRMASSCGLDVAESTLVQDRHGVSGLLVKRFDRVFLPGQPSLQKVHQEDGCQILDRYPADKYRITAQQLCDAFDEWTSTPALQKLRFLELYAFSYLIGNGDLHAKNVSLRISPTTGLTELSPAYDLLTTQAYRHLDQRMAMKLGPRDDNFRAQDFLNFGDRHGVREAAVRSMLAKLCQKAAPWLDRLNEIGWGPRDRQRVSRCLEDRLERLSN